LAGVKAVAGTSSHSLCLQPIFFFFQNFIFSHNVVISNTKKERAAIAFVKEKEITQPFTIRIPIAEYQQIRRIAFDKDVKINQIIVGLIKEYIKNNHTP
jgi:hypothetical protein